MQSKFSLMQNTELLINLGSNHLTKAGRFTERGEDFTVSTLRDILCKCKCGLEIIYHDHFIEVRIDFLLRCGAKRSLVPCRT